MKTVQNIRHLLFKSASFSVIFAHLLLIFFLISFFSSISQRTKETEKKRNTTIIFKSLHSLYLLTRSLLFFLVSLSSHFPEVRNKKKNAQHIRYFTIVTSINLHSPYFFIAFFLSISYFSLLIFYTTK